MSRPRRPDRRTILLAALALVLAALAAYSNTFSVPFFFDDTLAITNNASIRHWSSAFFPPAEHVAGVIGRPFVNFTLAVDYAFGGLEVRGYHITNLLLHVLAALTLFGIVRRTLLRPPLDARYGKTALPLAFAVALIWTVHPLQTESVTSIIQRTELLVGLFYLLTLYCFIRSVDAPQPQRWQAAAVGACLFGMLSKEVMVTAPLVVLLYDRAFVGGTFRAAWERRWKFYCALSATWMPLGALILNSAQRGGTVGFGLGISWQDYALKQCQAVVHYLRLTIWPHPLVLDYGTDVVSSAQTVWPQMAVLAALGATTLYALWRKPRLGFLGACFFLILAPSSSIVPLTTQTMAEHRMYLPLAVVACLLVLAIYARIGRWAIAAAMLLAGGFGLLTHARNTDYRSAAAMWAANIAQNSRNARAQYNYGCALLAVGRNPEALGEFLLALDIDPNYSDARSNIGDIFARLGRLDDAAEIFQTVLRTKPDDAHTLANLGCVYLQKGDLPRAAATFRIALQNDPENVQALANLGAALNRLGQPDKALPYLEHVVQIEPDLADAHFDLGNALLGAGQLPEAAAQYNEALRLRPDFAEAHNNLGSVLVKQGQPGRAMLHFKDALRLRPDYAEAKRNLDAVEAAATAAGR